MPPKKKKTAVKKRPVKKKAPKKVSSSKKASLKRKSVSKAGKTKNTVIGNVTHYFSKIGAAAIKLKGPLSIGDKVRIKGHTTDFTQKIASMQIEHAPVTAAGKGKEIGVLVDSRVREKDIVYKA